MSIVESGLGKGSRIILRKKVKPKRLHPWSCFMVRKKRLHLLKWHCFPKRLPGGAVPFWLHFFYQCSAINLSICNTPMCSFPKYATIAIKVNLERCRIWDWYKDRVTILSGQLSASIRLETCFKHRLRTSWEFKTYFLAAISHRLPGNPYIFPSFLFVRPCTPVALRPLDQEPPFLAKCVKTPGPKHCAIARCEVCVSIYITYILVSKSTPLAVTGPHGQLASLLLPSLIIWGIVH